MKLGQTRVYNPHTHISFNTVQVGCSLVTYSYQIFYIPDFLYYSKYGILVFDDDETGSADGSKRTKRVQGWSRQIMGGGFYYLQYYHYVK